MRKKKEYNNNIIKQIERLNNQCMTSLRNDDGGTASQDGNLAPLSKVSKEKPPIKRNLTRSGNHFTIYLSFKYIPLKPDIPTAACQQLKKRFLN